MERKHENGIQLTIQLATEWTVEKLQGKMSELLCLGIFII